MHVYFRNNMVYKCMYEKRLGGYKVSENLIARRPSVRLLAFHIFIFSSKTPGSLSTKLGTKHPWDVQIQMKGHALFLWEIDMKSRNYIDKI